MDSQVPIVPPESSEVFPVVPQTLEDPERPKEVEGLKPKDSHWISILAMAIFVVLTLGVVAFLYYQNQALKSMLASYQTPVPVASPTPTATADPTAGWKTYTNIAYGYSIKYPSTFTIGDLSGADPIEGISTSRNLYFYQTGDAESYANRYINIEIFQANPSYNQGVKSKITLDNLPATKIIIPNAKFDIYSVSPTTKEFVEINVSNDPAKKELASQILSTFKFLGAETGTCQPTFPIETNMPELTASENYAMECSSKQTRSDCLSMDVYNAKTKDFSKPDGIPDCIWTTTD